MKRNSTTLVSRDIQILNEILFTIGKNVRKLMMLNLGERMGK